MQSISVFWESIKYCLASFTCLFLFVQLICGKKLGGRVVIADPPVFLTNHRHQARMDSDVYNFERLQKIRQVSLQQLPNFVADVSVGSRESPRWIGRLSGLV